MLLLLRLLLLLVDSLEVEGGKGVASLFAVVHIVVIVAVVSVVIIVVVIVVVVGVIIVIVVVAVLVTIRAIDGKAARVWIRGEAKGGVRRQGAQSAAGGKGCAGVLHVVRQQARRRRVLLALGLVAEEDVDTTLLLDFIGALAVVALSGCRRLGECFGEGRHATARGRRGRQESRSVLGRRRSRRRLLCLCLCL